MRTYWHSVTLEPDYCNGCTHCLDRCPTQAIRIVDGKARIISERCIDCGECLKVCPFHAKGALTDSIESIGKFAYTIALPAISLYGQFGSEHKTNRVFNTFLRMGFDDVYDVAYAADLLTVYESKVVTRRDVKKPLISTFCPAITRLIQIRYPSLIENIIRLESPMEVAARLARKEARKKTGLEDHQIGVFYITQCPAKITSIKNPIGIDRSAIDGAISIESLYSRMIKEYDHVERERKIQKASGNGIGWGRVGGQSFAMGIENYLAVDGIDEVIKVLDNMELGKLGDVDFFEGYACVTGCVGGPLNVENPFIAKNRIRRISKAYGSSFDIPEDVELSEENMEWDREIKPNAVLKLDPDFKSALEKMSRIEEIIQTLPGINCGACGAPTCRALAEDIVLGRATIEDCIVLMHKKRER